MKRVSKIAASGTIYGKLGNQLAAQASLNRELKQLLPPPLDGQLKATVLQNNHLSLFVASPVWASRFRYLLPRLQQQLREMGIKVERIGTRILADDSARPARRQTRGRPTLSAETSKQLEQTAETIDDPSLR
ncbi:MAG: DciA family protein, partial [Candidatus Thiodiazotropha sp.]